MAPRNSSGHQRERGAPMDMLEAIAEQRHAAALQRVAELQQLHPDESVEQLSNRLIKACARDLAMAGAVSGGAAASPAAGPAGAAALLGAEGAMNAARLGELVMGIGVLHGHRNSSGGDRAIWLAAALGAAEGTALGVTAMAARAGVRGGARILRRLPAGAPGSALGRLATNASSRTGPWALVNLLPYTLGASVGAAGNTALSLSVGRAATRYFSRIEDRTTDRDSSQAGGGDTGERARPGSPGDPTPPEEIWDVEVISETILDDRA